MSITQLRCHFKLSLLGFGLLAGIAGCGLIHQPPVAEEAVSDARGAPVRPSAEHKARLQLLHDQTTMVFIKQPGVGAPRMGRWSRPDYDIVHAQKPDYTKNPHRDVPEWFQPPDETPLDKEIRMFRGNFKNQVKQLSRDIIFEPLQFRQVQLVGLARPANPVVYETDDVTMGTEMTNVSTRPLDAFETWGLKKLKTGEDLYIAKLNTGKLRILGPIYAGAMCIGCHSQPGEMLGAFSYTFDVGPPKAKAPGVAPLQPVP